MTARRIWAPWRMWVGLALWWHHPATARYLRRSIYRRNPEGLS